MPWLKTAGLILFSFVMLFGGIHLSWHPHVRRKKLRTLLDLMSAATPLVAGSELGEQAASSELDSVIGSMQSGLSFFTLPTLRSTSQVVVSGLLE
jgi:hypothetical protein